jgi:hypothetical protein
MGWMDFLISWSSLPRHAPFDAEKTKAGVGLVVDAKRERQENL